MDRRNKQTVLHTNNTRSSVPVYRNSIFSRFTKSYDHPKGDRGYKRNRHYKYIPAVIALLFATGAAVAETPPISAYDGDANNNDITGKRYL